MIFESDERLKSEQRIKELEAEVERLWAIRVPENAWDMACARCNVEDCDFRWDRYNIDCEPGIDCLGTK